MMRNLVWMGLVACATAVCAAEKLPALVLTSPLDYQVFQRETKTGGVIVVEGTAPAGAQVEAQLDAQPWQPVAADAATRKFSAKLPAAAGGWYKLAVRAAGQAPVVVAHVGVGEVFVVAGQSNSGNHGSEKQKTATGLVSSFDGTTWRLAHDPQRGASGQDGSFMPAFGDALAARLGVPVAVVPCGIGATSVREWLPKGATFPNPPTIVSRVEKLPNGAWASKGAAFAGLMSRMKQVGPHGFRAVLWHQGESDANQKDPTRTLPGELYREYLERVIRESRRELGWDAPWFVALVSYHGPGDEASPDIRAAQASLWKDGIACEGPDSDGLRGTLRAGVHFNGKGLQAHGKLWAEKVGAYLEQLR